MTTPLGSTKEVVKVVVEAPVVSFRHPHFVVGHQPTFDMPPPSTIVGHIASAVGHWPELPLQFAYSFEFVSKQVDYEHQWIVRKEVKKTSIKYKAGMSPCAREFLYGVRLELYCDRTEFKEAFLNPRFCVVLGRSQDLACVRSVSIVELRRADSGYVEHTLLPVSLRSGLPWGTTVLMPEKIENNHERHPSFRPFIVLRERIFVGDTAPSRTRRVRSLQNDVSPDWWEDPTTSEEEGGKRLLMFHEIA